MNNSPFKVIWLKAGVAFCVPFFTTLGSALVPYTTGMVHVSSNWWIRSAVVVIVISAALVAGFSGLGSFLSTTFAEHKIKQEAGLPDSAPAPITAAQAAAPAIQSQSTTPENNPAQQKGN